MMLGEPEQNQIDISCQVVMLIVLCSIDECKLTIKSISPLNSALENIKNMNSLCNSK